MERVMRKEREVREEVPMSQIYYYYMSQEKWDIVSKLEGK